MSDKGVELPAQTDEVPVIGFTAGSAFTTKLAFTDDEQPFELVTV